MTRTEREELLRRYFDGEMSLDQEHDFFIEVALDKELRHGLKAQQEIDAAMKADRSNPTPAEYASLQSGLAGVLAAMPGSQPAGTVTASSSGTAGGITAGWGIFAGIGLVGIVVAVVLVVLFSSPDSRLPEAAPVPPPPSQSTGAFSDGPAQAASPLSSDTVPVSKPAQVRDQEAVTKSRTVEETSSPIVPEQSVEADVREDRMSEIRGADHKEEHPADALSPEEQVAPSATNADAQELQDEEIDIRAKVLWKDSNDEGTRQD